MIGQDQRDDDGCLIRNLLSDVVIITGDMRMRKGDEYLIVNRPCFVAGSFGACVIYYFNVLLKKQKRRCQGQNLSNIETPF
jgi:hypothetical protein